jgi:soluble lytic murein transglycosylase-like protein
LQRACKFATTSILVAAALLCAETAQAQIWVVTEADGSQRFTTQAEPGARVYMRTRNSRSTAVTATLQGSPYATEVSAAAAEAGVSPELVHAVIAAESNFDPRAVSVKGAQGLMQLMPQTAAELGVSDVWNPNENIRGGTEYLARLLQKYDDVSLALAAYNAGEGAVKRYGGIPPYQETQQYVKRVMGHYNRLRAREN